MYGVALSDMHVRNYQGGKNEYIDGNIEFLLRRKGYSFRLWMVMLLHCNHHPHSLFTFVVTLEFSFNG